MQIFTKHSQGLFAILLDGKLQPFRSPVPCVMKSRILVLYEGNDLSLHRVTRVRDLHRCHFAVGCLESNLALTLQVSGLFRNGLIRLVQEKRTCSLNGLHRLTTRARYDLSTVPLYRHLRRHYCMPPRLISRWSVRFVSGRGLSAMILYVFPSLAVTRDSRGNADSGRTMASAIA